MKKLIVTIVTALTLLTPSLSQPLRGKFAIIADSHSMNSAGDEIRQYAVVLQAEGLDAVIIEDRWKNPDSIRILLRVMHTYNRGFEGAVFIGDIPVPMLRDAQHLTSAFKMDQERYPWHRSSVPSDRFYEDFDLQFTFLKADTNGLYFYYRLDPESPQRLTPDIYTGRIRIPGDNDGAKLKAYLQKVADAHKNPDKVDKVLFFAGHGYNSESMTARLDEKAALLQQFPQLNRQDNGLEYIDYTFDEHIKNRLLSTMTTEMIDVALLHHHGAPEAELAGSEQAANGVQQNIESIKFYLRSKVRGAKDTVEAKSKYIEWLGVPDTWFKGANEKIQSEKDSAWFADMDIISSDVMKYDIKTRFIIFDACFNGSFHTEEFISGAYVFGNGRTIAAQANTVNSIQDKFPDEMIGLLSYGMRVGEWNRMVCFLESHIIGDPTFRFSASDPKLNAIMMLISAGNNAKLLKLTDFPHPDVQSWALWQLSANGYPDLSRLLADKYFSSPYAVTRMTALKLLAEIKDDNFIRVTGAALNDSYELVRRIGAVYCQESGDPRLAPALIKAVTDPNISKRVNYQAEEALSYFDRDLLLSELNKRFSGVDTANHLGTIYRETIAEINKRTKSCTKTIASITSPEVTEKEKIFEIRSLRNSTFHPAIIPLCDYLLTSPGEKIEVELIEALGWFNYSYNREMIIDTCKKIIADKDRFSDPVRQEVIRTIHRLE
ncbi:MAG TPA: HEAT repeat domain-containing protein [Bacteroidales bacterium]|nr:HEAT repeat domain-containing protein [Bacteroidales bacterium]